MKKSLYGFVLCISILLSACSQTRYVQEPSGDSYYDEPSNSISYQQFYNDLDPYGRWVNSLEFGSVWVPGISGFRPYYSNGNWAYTNYGWTWVSNYNWGWAPFHYGRWYYDNFYGWAWVPGYEWGPAWVNWRSNSQYYGWAPLCPQTRDGRYYQIRDDQWAFVPHQYINRRDLNNYYVRPQNNVTIINNTTEINNVRVINKNTKYEEGPNVAEVEKVTKRRIVPLAVKPSPVPGETKVQNGAVRIFKPVVKESNITTGSAVNPPTKVVERRNLPATIQRQQSNVKTITPGKTVIRKQDEGTPNNSQVKVTSPEANNVATDNNDKPATPVIINKPREFQSEQIQRDVRSNTQRMRSINSDNQVQKTKEEQAPQENRTQQQVPQQNRSNINVPERRSVVTPRQSTTREIEQQQRVRNDQQQRMRNDQQQSMRNDHQQRMRNDQLQNSSNYQRPERENRTPVYDRPSNSIPNNNPVQVPRRFSR